MPEMIAFKSGNDLGEETRAAVQDTVTCVDCGAVESDESAYQNGWQLDPPVCASCLRWVAVDDAPCCSGSAS
jgi:hypothetical protein